VERRDDGRGEDVEVVDGQVGLPAGAARDLALASVAEDREAQLAARLAQAHALAHAQEEAGDLGVSEQEAAAGPDALVAAVHVLAGRAGHPGVGVALGRLADGDRQAEGMALRARRGHAAVPRPSVEVAPAAALEAVQPDPVGRVLRTPRSDHGWIGARARHAADCADPAGQLGWHASAC
jgi:hypothetical protein